jgi:hypothetical protein
MRKAEELGEVVLRPLVSRFAFVSWSDGRSQFLTSDYQGSGSFQFSLYDILFCFPCLIPTTVREGVLLF